MPKRSDDDRDGAAFNRAYLTGFGERVRRLREKEGVTLKQVAQLSGLSDRYIIEVEKGAANPSLESVLSLARALQTSVLDLLPKDSETDMGASAGPTREILKLLERCPGEQVSQILGALSSFLEHARGRHIAIIGMRGSGKTTIGQILARRMTMPFYELDDLIENDTGLSLGEIFDLEGEQYYRAVEEKTLERVLKRSPGVIAAGGGLVMNPTALFLLKLHGFVVWLQASPEALIARVRSSKDQSRLSAHPQVSKQLKAILDRRTPYYAQADLVLDTTRKSPEDIVNAIVQAFQSPNKPKAGRERTRIPLRNR